MSLRVSHVLKYFCKIYLLTQCKENNVSSMQFLIYIWGFKTQCERNDRATMDKEVIPL